MRSFLEYKALQENLVLGISTPTALGLMGATAQTAQELDEAKKKMKKKMDVEVDDKDNDDDDGGDDDGDDDKDKTGDGEMVKPSSDKDDPDSDGDDDGGDDGMACKSCGQMMKKGMKKKMKKEEVSPEDAAFFKSLKDMMVIQDIKSVDDGCGAYREDWLQPVADPNANLAAEPQPGEIGYAPVQKLAGPGA